MSQKGIPFKKAHHLGQDKINNAFKILKHVLISKAWGFVVWFVLLCGGFSLFLLLLVCLFLLGGTVLVWLGRVCVFLSKPHV